MDSMFWDFISRANHVMKTWRGYFFVYSWHTFLQYSVKIRLKTQYDVITAT